MTKAEFRGVQQSVQSLALQIGLNPAARAYNLNIERVKKWAQRQKWNISHWQLTGPKPVLSPNVPSSVEAVANVVAHYGDRAKIGATIAGARALEHLADTPSAADLIKPASSIAADQWTKAVDRAAGWTQSRAAGVTVNVANIVPPSEAERADRRAVHAQLDAITRLLSAPKAL